MSWFSKKKTEEPKLLVCFYPQEDITAFELAVIVRNLTFAYRMSELPVRRSTWEQMPNNVKRHFRILSY